MDEQKIRYAKETLEQIMPVEVNNQVETVEDFKIALETAIEIMESYLSASSELPKKGEIEESIVKYCKRIEPKFTGDLFITDDFYTPPKNWTRLSLIGLSQAIHDMLKDKLNPEAPKEGE